MALEDSVSSSVGFVQRSIMLICQVSSNSNANSITLGVLTERYLCLGIDKVASETQLNIYIDQLTS